MSNIPITQDTQAGYRSELSSAALNKASNDNLFDILNLFNKANTMESNLIEINEVLQIENTMNDMNLNIIKQLYLKYLQDSSTSSMKIANIFPSDLFNDTTIDNQASINLDTNDVTLKALSSTNKLYLYDEVVGCAFIPDNLIVTVTPLADDEKIIDNDIMNCINPDVKQFYYRKCITDNTVTSVTCSIEITLSEDIVSTRDVNSISVCPFPSNSVDIVNIESMNFGNYYTIPTFAEHYGQIQIPEATTKSLTNAPNVRFDFKKIAVNKIRITLKQSTFVNGDNNTRIFYLGLKNFSVSLNKYVDDYSVFYSNVNFDSTKQVSIYGITTMFNNTSQINDMVQYEVFYYDINGIPHVINDAFPFTLQENKLLIKTKVFNSDSTPNIAKQQLQYKYL